MNWKQDFLKEKIEDSDPLPEGKTTILFLEITKIESKNFDDGGRRWYIHMSNGNTWSVPKTVALAIQKAVNEDMKGVSVHRSGLDRNSKYITEVIQNDGGQ